MALRASTLRFWASCICQPGSARFATDAVVTKAGSKEAAVKVVDKGAALLTREQWRAVKLPEQTVKDIPTTIGGIAFPNDIRSTSGLGVGDGIKTHTAKWLQAEGMVAGNTKSPMDYISEVPPQKVSGLVYPSYGSDDPALGCPVEYINLRGTTLEEPAVCKYTGNRFYSDDWKGGGNH